VPREARKDGREGKGGDLLLRRGEGRKEREGEG